MTRKERKLSTSDHLDREFVRHRGLGFDKLPSRRFWQARDGSAGWYEEDLGDGWTAAYLVVAQEDGQVVVAETRLFPTPSPHDEGMWITNEMGEPVEKGPTFIVSDSDIEREPGTWSGDLSSIPSGGQRTRTHLRELKTESVLSSSFARSERFAARNATSAIGDKPRDKRKPRRDPKLLAKVAVFYSEAREAGSRKPNEEVLLRLCEDNLDVSRGTVGDLVRAARRPENGFLSPTSRGRAGGSATRKAYDLLAAD